MCRKHPTRDEKRLIDKNLSRAQFFCLFLSLVGASLLGSPVRSQGRRPEWQAEVRKYAEAKDWDSALKIVDREVALAPRDMDVRSWRARVLAWSGKLAEAETEYLEILRFARSDTDDWMGLAVVYLR